MAFSAVPPMDYWRPHPSHYLDQVEDLQARYPSLSILNELLHDWGSDFDAERLRLLRRQYERNPNGFPGRAAVVEFPDSTDDDGVPRFRDLTDINVLLEYLGNPTRNCRRRIFLLEDLALPYIEAFGYWLKVDPRVFASQLRNVHWDNPWKGFQRTLRLTRYLAAQSADTASFTLKYYEPRMVKDRLKTFNQGGAPVTNSSFSVASRRFEPDVKVKRKVTQVRGGKDEVSYGYNVGLLRGQASFWSRSLSSEPEWPSWDAILLLDAPFGRHDAGTEEREKPLFGTRAFVEQGSNRLETKRIVAMPYQGGYPDMRPLVLGKSITYSGPPRESMFDDLRFYFRDRSLWTKIRKEFAKDSSGATGAIYLKMLVAAHWNAFLNHLFATISALEQAMGDVQANLAVHPDRVEEQKKWAYIEEDLRSMNMLRRRLHWYIEQMDENLFRLGIPPDDAPDPADPAAPPTLNTSINKDFLDIADRLRQYKSQTDDLVSLAGKIATIRQAKRALADSHYVGILTVVGLVVFPLTFLCSVFSMGGNFSPGQSLFWLYWVIGIPLVLIILVVLQVTREWDRKREGQLHASSIDMVDSENEPPGRLRFRFWGRDPVKSDGPV